VEDKVKGTYDQRKYKTQTRKKAQKMVGSLRDLIFVGLRCCLKYIFLEDLEFSVRPHANGPPDDPSDLEFEQNVDRARAAGCLA